MIAFFPSNNTLIIKTKLVIIDFPFKYNKTSATKMPKRFNIFFFEACEGYEVSCVRKCASLLCGFLLFKASEDKADVDKSSRK